MIRKSKKKKVTAMILTGGQGRRMKTSDIPKQFIRVFGKPLFVYSLESYDKIKEVDDICLVVNKAYLPLYKRVLKKYHIKKLKYIVPGGKFRQDSVKNGIDHIEHDGLVIIHNGAAPTTSKKLIRACIKAAQTRPVVTAAIGACHTIFLKDKNKIGKMFDRHKLGYTSEPQIYRASVIKKICRNIGGKSKRDIPILKLVRQHKYPVHLVPSDLWNYKVTNEADLEYIKYVIKNH